MTSIFQQGAFEDYDIRRVCEEFEYLFNAGYVHLSMDFEEENLGLLGMRRDVQIEAERRYPGLHAPKLSIKQHETVKVSKTIA